MTIEENQKAPTIATSTSPPETHHVLMVSLSAQGHMNPHLRLGKRLLSKGLHVTLATPEIARQLGPLVSRSLFNDHEEEDVELDMWKADESCMEWLDQQAPCSVIYVSFGSLLTLPGETIESIATALKKTEIPFLWVVKVAEVKVNGVKAPKLEEAGENGRVVEWSPQSRVLKHPSVGCFLTHCGWNSILEALTAGVLLICYPQWTDQPTNAKLVEEVFGVGLRLWPDKEGWIGAEEIERSIGDIMVGQRAEKIRARAAEWKQAAKEVVAHDGSSGRNIQWFINEIVKLSM